MKKLFFNNVKFLILSMAYQIKQGGVILQLSQIVITQVSDFKLFYRVK